MPRIERRKMDNTLRVSSVVPHPHMIVSAEKNTAMDHLWRQIKNLPEKEWAASKLATSFLNETGLSWLKHRKSVWDEEINRLKSFEVQHGAIRVADVDELKTLNKRSVALNRFIGFVERKLKN
ncbi:MAG: hypothetical protein NUV57_03675 [archaeon]|nr:hypothetical protein [archaeon]